jgi:uncharacterized repeat protein (TIGR01451 family)
MRHHIITLCCLLLFIIGNPLYSQVDCCDLGDDPITITFRYVGDDCSVITYLGANNCEETGALGTPVYIIVSDDANPFDPMATTYYSETVNSYQAFTVNAGADGIFPNNAFLHILDMQSGITASVEVESSCSGAGAEMYAGQQIGPIEIVNITYANAYVCGTTSCDFVSANMGEVDCGNAGTFPSEIDDYIVFSLHPNVVLGSTYSVAVQNSAGTTVSVSSVTGSPATAVNYGTPTIFRLPFGSAGSGETYTLSVSDDTDAACNFQTTFSDPGTCSDCYVAIDDINIVECPDNLQIAVTVVWDNAPDNENIEVIVDNQMQIIDVVNALTNEATVCFSVDNDGNINELVTAGFEGDQCSDPDGEMLPDPTPPTVNGLFYGDGDFEKYTLIAASTENSGALYTYLDDATGLLYVAVLYDDGDNNGALNLNDNVFGGSGDYLASAGWGSHTFQSGLEETDNLKLRFLCDGTEYSWFQDLVDNSTDDETLWGPDPSVGTWTSSAEVGDASSFEKDPGAHNPPPNLVSASSPQYNMIQIAADIADNGVIDTHWDVTQGGTLTDPNDWISPNADGDGDVTDEDGYPTYSTLYDWEWPIVYEMSFDVSGCTDIFVEITDMHNSPTKSGTSDITIAETNADPCTALIACGGDATPVNGCDLDLTQATILSCTDNVASIEATLIWLNAPVGENVLVQAGNTTELVAVSTGLTPPHTFQFQVPLENNNDLIIEAAFETSTACDDNITVIPPADCVDVTDVTIQKYASPSVAQVGDIITYVIVIENTGNNLVTGTTMTDILPDGVAYNSDDSGGAYDSNTGIWTVGNINPGETATINIEVEIILPGVHTNVATVDISGLEANVTNNQDDACVSVPVELPCSGDGITLEGQTGFTSYQWYKDDVMIDGATNSNLLVTEAGTYNYVVDGGTLDDDCSNQMCCAVIISEAICENCPPIQCLPVSITIIND